MPKLEGFWSEDVESPTQLSGEQKIVNGMPYRAYLLRRRALFPVKPGTLTITAAEADITTGFLFAGHRVHRVSNALKLKVKPLPPGGPAGMASANVGNWRLSMDVSPDARGAGPAGHGEGHPRGHGQPEERHPAEARRRPPRSRSTTRPPPTRLTPEQEPHRRAAGCRSTW